MVFNDDLLIKNEKLSISDDGVALEQGETPGGEGVGL